MADAVIEPDEKAARLARRSRLLGILLMCGALIAFSFLDAGAKWLGQSLHPVQVTWARYAANVFLVAIVLNPWTHPGVTRTKRPGLQLARSVLVCASTLANFFALQYLQLAQTVSILFATPLLVALIAGPLLGEWVGPRRMIAIVVGFVGILIITRPFGADVHPAALLSVFSALCYAIYAIATRVVSAHDSSATTLFYSGLVGAVVMTPFMPFVWIWPESWLQWAVMGLIGFCGAFGHWLLILAHARAPAPILSPFIYSQIIWMIALGYLIFGDLPDGYTLIGAVIVIASGLYLLSRERVRSGA